jgi:predicted nuclease of predicted toxin-antitoxin system
MKFLIDAQLPARLARLLVSTGHDALHASGLQDGNRTTDRRITEVADEEDRVVVTKDRDFRDGHLLTGKPLKLLIVATGNITNTALLSLFEAHLEKIVAEFDEADYIELAVDMLVVHGHPQRGH